jgi:hypothetical protein
MATTARQRILAAIAASLAFVYLIHGSATAEEKPDISNDISVADTEHL